ncbi:MAG: DUF1553 domain-containing protein, partial [Planctomycetales bacterium]|nr:DUF1553 domain-containing protein [Planctomycetales bacterium]
VEAAQMQDTGPQKLSGPLAMGVRDLRRIGDSPLYEGGDIERPADSVPRGFLQVVHVDRSTVPTSAQSGRLELAEWLTQPDHPLTSRVMVNRMWHHLFGRGIVETVDNFGVMGSRPDHPELLDYLAVRFVADGWSVKRLIRAMVTSHAYQQSGTYVETNASIDGDNRLIWRMPPRRLEAEAIRDAVLYMSGQLDLDPPHGSPMQDVPLVQLRRRSPLDEAAGRSPYRSIYLPIMRSRVPEYLTAFDFPEPSDVKGSRDVTTVSTQALFLMNSPFIENQCQLAAVRLLASGLPPREIVRAAYLMTLNREPTGEQYQRVFEYVRELRQESSDRPRAELLQATADLLHALVASAEFRYH